MSDFGTLSVAFQSPNVESVTDFAPISRLSKVWHKLTRKPLPTITTDLYHFHNVELTSKHEADTFERVAFALENAGYTIVSVVVDDGYSPEELVNGYRISDAEEISALFRGLVDDGHRADAYVAHIKEYGWDASQLTTEWMDDNYRGGWSSAADYVEDLVTDCYEMNVPDFVEVDWESTAENLESDYDFVYYYGQIHVFRK